MNCQGETRPANTQCVAYVTDRNYLFPTIFSAIQARQQTSAATDVVVLLTEDIPDFPQVKRFLESKSVAFENVKPKLSHHFASMDQSKFMHRISMSAMARLIITDLLPENYESIIYIDGDTQVVGSLHPLEQYAVPRGKFLAARDFTSIKKYAESEVVSNYFNSGVLKIRRDGWVGPEALEFFRRSPDACNGMHDQGALNEVCGDSMLLMSNKWNFPKHFLNLLDDFEPALVHYMAHPKPWQGKYYPWGEAEYRIYEDLIQQNEDLGKYRENISNVRKVLYRYRSIKDSVNKRIFLKDDFKDRLRYIISSGSLV